MNEQDKLPRLPWHRFLPTHLLPHWKAFLETLSRTTSKSLSKDSIIRALLPLFHNPNVRLPMRTLTVQEVRHFSGLTNILTEQKHGSVLVTEKVVRDFCGNSFHPGLIDAALGTDESFRAWAHERPGDNPNEPRVANIDHVHTKYKSLLHAVTTEAAARGVKLSPNTVDLEAPWHQCPSDITGYATVIPEVHQPTLSGFIRVSATAQSTEVKNP